MQASDVRNDIPWAPSIYYAESVVACSIETAWRLLLEYQKWNPSFVGAQVTPVRGEPGSEGEVVLIKKQLLDVQGQPLPEFYAMTVKVVPYRHIVWYVHEKNGDSFRNFVDFGLSETSSAVKFNVYYYAQNRMSGELLAEQRKKSESTLEKLALAFKSYCETRPHGA